MSGVVKGVKKVFKKVGGIAKKVLPWALPVAAAVFTVGGMLGIPALAGGWSGAVSGLFGNSMLGSVLGGAVTQAGYGGLIGGGIGAIAGGKKGLIKGLGYGQMVGAATGAVTGAIGYAGSPAARGATSASTPGAAAGTGTGQATTGLQRSTDVMSGYGAELPGQVGGATGMSRAMVPAQAGMAQAQAAQGVTQAAQSLPSAGMVQGAGYASAPAAASGGAGWWANEDPIVKAAMITGGFTALPPAVAALTADEDSENPQLAVDKARNEQIASNYKGFGGSSPAFTIPPLANRPTVRYEYDQTVGRIVPRYS